MDWSAAHTLVAIVSAVFAFASAWLTLRLSAALDKLRLEIFAGRSEDKQEMREWINGSFMRSKEVEAKLDAKLDRAEAPAIVEIPVVTRRKRRKVSK